MNSYFSNPHLHHMSNLKPRSNSNFMIIYYLAFISYLLPLLLLFLIVQMNNLIFPTFRLKISIN